MIQLSKDKITISNNIIIADEFLSIDKDLGIPVEVTFNYLIGSKGKTGQLYSSMISATKFWDKFKLCIKYLRNEV